MPKGRVKFQGARLSHSWRECLSMIIVICMARSAEFCAMIATTLCLTSIEGRGSAQSCSQRMQVIGRDVADVLYSPHGARGKALALPAWFTRLQWLILDQVLA